MGIVFEWDENKANANLFKHGISFGEAATVFGDPLSLTIPDVSHSLNEKRYITLGKSLNNHLIVVVHTDRAEKIRIISARKASQKERKQY